MGDIILKKPTKKIMQSGKTRKGPIMFLHPNSHEAYWNSYRLLENQLLRLSHSISFDDNQINVYSSELADIINSACIKIESLAKDIYEEHIWPFQMDSDIVPISFTDGKPKKSADKFVPEKWVRDKWKFDYHCLVEIDRKFSLSKKRIELKTERFHFSKYGSTILPFGNISIDHCNGGYWEHSSRSPRRIDMHKLQAVDWCKSYQAIKHNYIQSIPEHGTIKNAIMVLSAFYLLAVYNSCLPARHFDVEDRNGRKQLDFGSELFSCGMCNYTIPPCIINGERTKRETEQIKSAIYYAHRELFAEQDLLNDVEGYPFLITLNKDVCTEVNSLVTQYCSPRGLDKFDIAPYRNKKDVKVSAMDAGDILYLNLKKYIMAPYNRSRICVTFNTGTEHVYDSLFIDHFGYEKSKHKKKTAETVAALQIGDIVDAKFIFDDSVEDAEVVKITEHSIDLSVEIDGTSFVSSQPKDNLIYIRIKKQNTKTGK